MAGPCSTRGGSTRYSSLGGRNPDWASAGAARPNVQQLATSSAAWRTYGL